MEKTYSQLYCLLVFIITGIFISILFDFFRILRRSFKTSDWLTYLQDILFCIIAGIIILFSIFTFNNGEIRSYIFIGIAVGVIIYIFTISKFIVKYSIIIINFIKKIISYPIRLIICIIQKLIINPIKLFINNISLFFKKITKNIKNIQKTKKI